MIRLELQSIALKKEEKEQQKFRLQPFAFYEHELFKQITEIMEVSANWALQVD